MVASSVVQLSEWLRALWRALTISIEGAFPRLRFGFPPWWIRFKGDCFLRFCLRPLVGLGIGIA